MLNAHAIFSGDVMLLTDKTCYTVIVISVEFFNYPFCEINRMIVGFTALLSSREQPSENTDLLHIPPGTCSHLFN